MKNPWRAICVSHANAVKGRNAVLNGFAMDGRYYWKISLSPRDFAQDEKVVEDRFGPATLKQAEKRALAELAPCKDLHVTMTAVAKEEI
jgi:hypothetical protein